MKRYLTFLAIWAGTWFLVDSFGEWYWTTFDINQALVAIFLLFTSQTILKPFWWRKELGIVLTLQMFLNVGDAAYNWPPDRYNAILSTLNWLELAIIVFFGLGTFLWARMKKHEPAAVPAHPDRGDGSAKSRVHQRHA